MNTDAVTVSSAGGQEIEVIASGEDSRAILVASARRCVHDGRRHAIALHGWCECCGHAFVWTLTQHKGQTLTELRLTV